jgi:hypothetical protein
LNNPCWSFGNRHQFQRIFKKLFGGFMSLLSEFWKRLKTNFALRQKAIAVMQSREAKNINFTVFGFALKGTDFGVIASEIDAASPNRFVVHQPNLGTGVGAQYDNTTNTLEMGLDPSNSRTWKGAVIHESVHAIADKRKSTLPDVQEEAIAYIAEAIYFRRVGLSRSRINAPIHLAARDLGNLILQGKTPTITQLNKLTSLILADPVYSGIGLTATSTLYSNDG